MVTPVQPAATSSLPDQLDGINNGALTQQLGRGGGGQHNNGVAVVPRVEPQSRQGFAAYISGERDPDRGVGVGLESDCAALPQTSGYQLERGAGAEVSSRGLVSESLDFVGTKNERASEKDGFQDVWEEEEERLRSQLLEVEKYAAPPLNV
nr:hypothetical protein Itr_chr06CG17860 [Ipomoea trifida]